MKEKIINEPDSWERCIICGQQGYLVGERWYEYYTTYSGEVEGYSALRDAAMTAHGWVCSRLCRSQAMYSFASPSDQYALRAVHDACRAIMEYGARAVNLIEREMEESGHEALIHAVDGVLSSICDDAKDCPQWINRESREQVLESAIFIAKENLDFALRHDEVNVQSCRYALDALEKAVSHA